MTVMATHGRLPSQADLLEEGFLALSTPEGFRAELIEGEIVVTPPPDGGHQDTIDLVVRQVYAHSRVAMQQSGNSGLLLPAGEGCPRNRVIADLVFAPLQARLFAHAGSWMPPDGVAMVVEVTSSRAERDRVAKRRCYARGAIPLYLLIDREESAVTLFSEPSNADYRAHTTTPTGKPVPLPEPFAFDLDTAEFL
ncbi:Uma2 family endonuclease [Streptomyces hoynatensis]|uniref:Uma2 family endonuclease n=1 Tax=Streptomyces hoynatensis TaxID=1141874 RepID=A0A3A9YP54_9ACTN|nr:Uma2 family endonuclease [Streptomyces hoynatensis]RKN36897.1 Uma2 family endonuclease [Streptomyces hoynatensis]